MPTFLWLCLCAALATNARHDDRPHSEAAVRSAASPGRQQVVTDVGVTTAATTDRTRLNQRPPSENALCVVGEWRTFGMPAVNQSMVRAAAVWRAQDIFIFYHTRHIVTWQAKHVAAACDFDPDVLRTLSPVHTAYLEPPSRCPHNKFYAQYEQTNRCFRATEVHALKRSHAYRNIVRIRPDYLIVDPQPLPFPLTTFRGVPPKFDMAFIVPTVEIRMWYIVGPMLFCGGSGFKWYQHNVSETEAPVANTSELILRQISSSRCHEERTYCRLLGVPILAALARRELVNPVEKTAMKWDQAGVIIRNSGPHTSWWYNPNGTNLRSSFPALNKAFSCNKSHDPKLCSDNSGNSPWVAAEFRSGCSVWVKYIDSKTQETSEFVRLVGVGDPMVSTAQLLHVAKDVCDKLKMVKRFAEDFSGLLALSGIEEGETVALTINDPATGNQVVHATNSGANRDAVNSQWKGSYDANVFNPDRCPDQMYGR